MKRFLCLLIVACSLTACIKVEIAGGSPTPSLGARPLSPTPLPISDEATTSARIRARGILVVGVRYDLEPFGYVTDEGEVAGFDVDLGRELARRWLGDSQAVQFRQVRSDTAVEHLQANDMDIVIAALTHTKDREAEADFSSPYFIDGQALLVRAADANLLNSPASLEGRPVGVVAWGEADEALQGAVEFTPAIQTYERFDEAVETLGWGGVDAVADLRRRLFWGRRMLPDTVIVGQYTSEPVAIAFPQNDPFFADLVNLTLQEIVTDGTYANLYSRWFAPELPPAVERWPGTEIPSLASAPAAAIIPDTIAAIQSRGRLAVALVLDRSPFAYMDETGAPAGYEVGLARQMAERWLGDATAVDFMPVSVDAGKQMVRTGQVDLLIGGLPHIRAAELELDFSLMTYVAGEGLLIQAGTEINDLNSLKGQQVAAVEGSGSGEVLLAAAQNAGISLTVLPQPSLEAAIASLQAGQVVAIVGERADLLGPAYATPGLGVLPLRLTQVPLALGLPPGDSAFRDLVNLTLQTMKEEGQFDAVYATWFDDAAPTLEGWPGVPYRPLRLEVTAPGGS
jgi:putative glutamine transport system substrate-binding protein